MLRTVLTGVFSRSFVFIRFPVCQLALTHTHGGSLHNGRQAIVLQQAYLSTRIIATNARPRFCIKLGQEPLDGSLQFDLGGC